MEKLKQVSVFITIYVYVIFLMMMWGIFCVDVYTIEFHKRGLPHVHILFWLHLRDKLREADDIDMIISSKIPNKTKVSKLYALVKRFMVHVVLLI